MERLLLRRMNRVLRRTAHSEAFNVLLCFPAESFKEAPQWSPGEGFFTCIDNYSWYRADSRDNTVTAVVAGVGPKLLPAYDGGEWKEPEVWAVELSVSGMTFHELWNKPHRVTWLLQPDIDDPEPEGTILNRQPLAGHPSEELLQYWDAFELEWGFVPHRRKDRLVSPLDPYYLSVAWNRYDGESLTELARSLAWLIRRFNARFSIWSKQQLDALPDNWPHEHPAQDAIYSYPWRFARARRR